MPSPRASIAIVPLERRHVDALVAMSARLHGESAYAFLPFDPAKVRAQIAAILDEPTARCGFVAELGGASIGMLLGYLADYAFCDETIACDAAFWVDPRFRGSPAAPGLVSAFRDWAAARGAREIALAISTGVDPERAGRFLGRMGLSHRGGVFKQRLR